MGLVRWWEELVQLVGGQVGYKLMIKVVWEWLHVVENCIQADLKEHQQLTDVMVILCI